MRATISLRLYGRIATSLTKTRPSAGFSLRERSARLATNPHLVSSPKLRLKGLRVIYSVTEWSLALGLWDGKRALLVRWNGDNDTPLGNPISRANPTWFVLPRDLRQSTLQNIPNPNCSSANNWLDGGNPTDWDDVKFSPDHSGSI